MRKASIVERSAISTEEKKNGLKKLVDEARIIRERMAASFKRLSPTEIETLGPGRRKEIEQLTETIESLEQRATALRHDGPCGATGKSPPRAEELQ